MIVALHLGTQVADRGGRAGQGRAGAHAFPRSFKDPSRSARKVGSSYHSLQSSTWKFPSRVIPKEARHSATRPLMFSQGVSTFGFSWMKRRTATTSAGKETQGKGCQ